jgi:Fe-S-cluster containining protein
MLDELYASLPAVECRGLCHDTCTAIDASELERRRLAERGVRLPEAPATAQLREIVRTGTVPRCPALSPLNTCTVYDVRPFTCRAFGVVMQAGADRAGLTFAGPMMCDHGCVPDGTVDLREYARAIRQIEALSVAVTGVRRQP